VLVGPLESALFQAGAVDVLLGVLPRPATVYAAGFSVTIALLLADSRDAARFRQRWEALRASHLLSIAACARSPYLRPFVGGADSLATRLDSLAWRLKALGMDRGSRPAEPPVSIHVMGAAGFETLEAGDDPSHRRSLLGQTLAWDAHEQEAAGLAIERASADENREVIVVGAPAEEIEPAGREPSDRPGRRQPVSLLARPSAAAVGLGEVLIAGSGAVERRIREGRIAADRWLGVANRAARDQSAGAGATAAG
jgi:hypothetical protein